MPEKLIVWSENKKWVMFMIRGVIGGIILLFVVQVMVLAKTVNNNAVDIQLMKSNRFTSLDGRNHDTRITIIETQQKAYQRDVSEIKADLKILIRK